MLQVAVFCGLLCVATAGLESGTNQIVVINDLRGFDDSILFDIDWTENTLFNPQIEDQYLVTDGVVKNEYSCAIPRLETKETASTEKEYTGPSPLDLVADLFTTAACSFRAESYWTYEVCHGDYIKQYHEEREGKSVKLQEYVLGRWNKKQTEELRERLAAAEQRNEPVQYKKIESLTLPYLEVDMSDGTPCGLIDNKPRSARVLYVCYPHGKNEVYSLKEVSTCQYEVVILTQALCDHPSYKPMAASENRIRCSPKEVGAPLPPQYMWSTQTMLSNNLQKLAAMNLKPDMEQYKRIIDDIGAIMTKHPEMTANAAALAASLTMQTGAGAVVPNIPTAPSAASGSDLGYLKAPFDEFVSGNKCLTGGHGWWKYEFCYEGYVRQFHKHKNGDESSVLLGKFNAASHRAWLTANPDKRPATPSVESLHSVPGASAGPTVLWHMYDDGETCELTGRPRHTVVKMKCIENTTHQSQLYLLEPATCEYVLSVESPLICELFRSVDKDGLVPSVIVGGSARV